MTEERNSALNSMDVPANIDVNVVENTDNTVHITMPMAPAGAANLSDEELAGVAGGIVFSVLSFDCADCAD